MPQDRFFVRNLFQESDQVELEEEESFHLSRVMRKKPGERVELVNGKNQFACAEIQHLDNKRVILCIVSEETRDPPKRKLILCQALCRSHRLDTIVEKGTELGMSELWIFPGALSEKKNLSSGQLKRLEKIMIAALKQSGRLNMPRLLWVDHPSQWLSIPSPAFFGDLSSHAQPLIRTHCMDTDALFFNGPESGFTDSEIQFFTHSSVQGVSLHTNTLRVDTAAIAALTLLSSPH